jgi:tRNA-modifying protein YgfZ
MAFYTPISSGAIRVTGTDRLDFVQGQVAQNIKTLPVPGVARSMILNVKGQIEFDVRIYRRKEDICIYTVGGLESSLLARLQKMIVFDDVKLQNISEHVAVLHVSGENIEFIHDSIFPDSINSSNGLFTAECLMLEGSNRVFLIGENNRGNGIGYDIHLEINDLENYCAWLEEKGANLVPFPDLEKLRINAKFPNAHTDGFTGMLPQECGLLEGVSFKKGCYVGQEIMARLDARGHSNKALSRVKPEQELETGTPVMSDGREVGQLGHVVPFETGFAALAVMRIDALEKPNLEAGGLKLEVDFSSVNPKL